MDDQAQQADANLSDNYQTSAANTSNVYSETPETPETPETASYANSPISPNDKLLEIKQKVLSELTPLITDLDQSPEERFKTILMIIQASDNQDLIKDAYSAAEKITDVKLRAQALLEIVNEINYFTQKAA